MRMSSVGLPEVISYLNGLLYFCVFGSSYCCCFFMGKLFVDWILFGLRCSTMTVPQWRKDGHLMLSTVLVRDTCILLQLTRLHHQNQMLISITRLVVLVSGYAFIPHQCQEAGQQQERVRKHKD